MNIRDPNPCIHIITTIFRSSNCSFSITKKRYSQNTLALNKIKTVSLMAPRSKLYYLFFTAPPPPPQPCFTVFPQKLLIGCAKLCVKGEVRVAYYVRFIYWKQYIAMRTAWTDQIRRKTHHSYRQPVIFFPVAM